MNPICMSSSSRKSTIPRIRTSSCALWMRPKSSLAARRASGSCWNAPRSHQARRFLRLAAVLGPMCSTWWTWPVRLAGWWLDASEIMISEARRRAEACAVPVPVSFVVGDAQALPFPDSSFDVRRAARLLEHVPDTAQVLAEMVRVTRPGGRILVFDIDWDTLIIDHPDKDTTRIFVSSHADSIRNGWIGRQLPRLFTEQRLQVRSLDAVQLFIHYAMAELAFGSHLAFLQTNGVLSAARAQQWWE
jgi:SAM-dependent methyltransferase